MDISFEDLWREATRELAARGIPSPPPPSAEPALPLPADVRELAGLIDETLLRPEATLAEIDAFLAASTDYPFATVCVHGAFVERAAAALSGTATGVAAVVGFPHGAAHPSAKAAEARRALSDGASEIDMVGPIGLLRSRDLAGYLADVREVREAVPGAVLKVILETAALVPLEIVEGSVLAVLGGADFVKTSTGFGPGGAAAEAVALMRRSVGAGKGVKAAGGIRDLADLTAMVEAGASRIGTSRGHAICAAWEGASRP